MTIVIAASALSLREPAFAAVTTQLSVGTSCGNASAANFTPAGTPVKIAVCVSTTTEKLCGVSYRLRAATAAQSGKFSVTARLLGASFNEATPATLPVSILNSPVGDLGSAPNPQVPVPAGAGQLVAILDITPQANATDASYLIDLDTPFSVALVDQDNTCGTMADPSEAPLSGSFTLTKAAAPRITSADNANFTVSFPATFEVTATGTPAPSIIALGTLPSGVTFSSGSRTFTGTPASGTVGSYPVAITASNGIAPDSVQNFVLVIQRRNLPLDFPSQTITTRTFSSGMTFSINPLAISGGSTSPVVYSTSNGVCTVTGSTVSIVTAGACTLIANQAADANYNAASPATQIVTINPIAPTAPAIGAATPGNAQASIAFSAPTSTGGLPIASYTASCNGGNPATGPSSPLVVTGLTNGNSYTCSVVATNAAGLTSVSSGTVGVTLQAVFTVTPNAGANGTISPTIPQSIASGATADFTVTPDSGYTAIVIGSCGGNLVGNLFTTNPITANCSVQATFAPSFALVAVESRKLHGATEYNRPINPLIPITGLVDVEPRTIGAGHAIIFRFNATVTNAGTVSAVYGNAIVITATSRLSNNEVLVTVPNVADNARVKISLVGVNGNYDTSASIGFLVGDVSNSRSVNASDVAAIKARIGKPITDGNNFLFDINTAGGITSADVTTVKARSGLVLP